MNIGHLIPYIGKNFGGPVSSVIAISKGLSSININTTLFSTYKISDGPKFEIPDSIYQQIDHDYYFKNFRLSPNLKKYLATSNIDLIHSHGLWTDISRKAYYISRKKKIPHILSPCGMLDSSALRISRYQKKLAFMLYQKNIIHEASCIIAKSEQEFNDIRNLGFRTPVSIIPNFISNNSQESAPVDSKYIDISNTMKNKKNIIFLGRLHPVKGLELLLEVWKTIYREKNEWQLLLFGPNENNYKSNLINQLKKYNIETSVRFMGVLEDKHKYNVLKKGDLFIMPSMFENFGSAIVEAMSAGLPIITTSGTPWNKINELGAGWCVDRNFSGIRDALIEGINLTDLERESMGSISIKISDDYKEEKVINDLKYLYEWQINKTKRPDFIILD